MAVAGSSMPWANAGAAGAATHSSADLREELAPVHASSSRARSIAVPIASGSPSASAGPGRRPVRPRSATACRASTAWIESATASSPALAIRPS